MNDPFAGRPTASPAEGAIIERRGFVSGATVMRPRTSAMASRAGAGLQR
ncbi:hypothetical protein O8B39_23420 [Agrobacterium rhizogenes]|nr:hypothetical protein [Rhizobium rhizogenes]